MIQGLYSAASALEAAEQNHDVVAQNLAHATMPGYRRQISAFETFEEALDQANGSNSTNSMHGTRSQAVYTDFQPGTLEHTGNPLDVAATGNIFFVVDGPDGPMLTRNGSFQLNAQSQLQTSSGQLVRGEGGPITLPPRAGNVVITSDGRVLADNQPVGQLKLVEVNNPSQLQRVGTTFFRGVDVEGQQRPTSVRIEQGYREGSNVQVVNEIVSMMAGLRHYEAAQRALKVLGDAIALSTQPNS